MVDSFKNTLVLTWNLAQHQQDLLGLLLPTTHEVARCMMEGRKPSPSQVDTWNAVLQQVTQRMQELTSDFSEVQRAIVPLIEFDA